MNGIQRMIVCTCVLVAFAANVASAGEFGRTPGKFELLSTGAAGYRIPIWTPDGPQGVEPTLSLQYDSQSKFGNAGPGWTLAGISSIERCPKNEPQDGGEIKEVTLTTNDRFCMNGNRLRHTSASGSYGLPSSTYQLELQQFMSITASAATAGTGPQYFIAKGKNGWTYEFGRTPDSRALLGPVPDQPPTPNRWLLNKITDRNQNTLAITYQSNYGTGVPTKIEWGPTYNGSTTYLYSAEFTWVVDPSNAFRGFIGTYAVVDNNRLTSITIKHNSSVVRKYVFGYSPGPATQVMRLASLTECSDDGAANCLLPTIFTYQDGSSGLVQGTGSVPVGSGATTTTARDLNGDGRDDLVYKNGGNWLVAFANATGFGTPLDTGFSSSSYLVGRFSPNGGDSFVVPRTTQCAI